MNSNSDQQTYNFSSEILEHLTEAILVVSSSLECIYCNQAARELFDLPAEESKTKHLTLTRDTFSILHPLLPVLKSPANDIFPITHSIAGKEVVVDLDHEAAVFIITIRGNESTPSSEHLDGSHSDLYAFLNTLPDGVLLADKATKKFVFANDRICEMLGYRKDQLLGKPIHFIHPEEEYPKIENDFSDLEQNKINYGSDIRVKRKDGSLFYANISTIISNIDTQSYITGLFRDVTREKLQNQAQKRYQKILKAHSEISHSIIQQDDLEETLRKACQIVVETGGFSMSWIGRIQDNGELKPVAQAGKTGSYLDDIVINIYDEAQKSGPAARSILSKRVQLSNDIEHDPAMRPWKEAALDHGFKSAASFPMIIGDRVIGALIVYASVVDFFDQDEIDVLQELAGDLAIAIQLHDNEQERKRAEENQRTVQFGIEHAQIGIFQIDEDGTILFANSYAHHYLGYKTGELIEKKIFEIDPNFDHQHFREHRNLTKKLRSRTITTTHQHKDGHHIPVEVTVSYYELNGELYSFSFSKDISKQIESEQKRERVVAELKERVKELKCLYEVSKLIDEPDITEHKLLQSVADLIPDAMQHPDHTCVRIDWNQHHFTTGNTTSCDTQWRLTSHFIDASGRDGTIIVFYNTELTPSNLSDPFLQEERKMIDTVAKTIQRYLDQKTSERNLISSEEKFRNIFQLHDAVEILIDPKTGQIKDANQSAVEFYGWTVDELQKMNISDINTLSTDELQDEMSKAVNQERNYFEFRHRKKDGTIADVEVFSSGIPIEGEKLLHSIIHDVTDKHYAQTQLKLLTRSVEQSPVSIVITDRDGTIEYVNKGFTKVTGYTKQEVIGQNPNILKSGIQSRKFYKKLWDTITAGRDWEGQFANLNKNGNLYWEKAVISPIQNNHGEITHFVAVKENITEKKAYIEAIERQNKILKDIAWTQSHVVRAPIARMKGLLALYTMNEGESMMSRPEILNLIENSLEELEDIVQEISEKTYVAEKIDPRKK